MVKYKILCELTRKEQFGEKITTEEKNVAISTFLDGRNDLKETSSCAGLSAENEYFICKSLRS